MSLINASGSCKWIFKLVICKSISLGIKNVAIFYCAKVSLSVHYIVQFFLFFIPILQP